MTQEIILRQVISAEAGMHSEIIFFMLYVCTVRAVIWNICNGIKVKEGQVMPSFRFIYQSRKSLTFLLLLG